MKDDVAKLEITPYELEKVCGREVNDLLIGGIVGGVIRSSVWKDPTKILSLVVIEIAVAGLLVMFTLPISFALTKNNPTQAAGGSLFLGVTLAISIALIALWNYLMITRAKQFKMLMRLLDEIDRFNELVRAVDLVDRLDEVQPDSGHFNNRLDILNALNMTRDSLISGIMTEKILRENRSLLARRQDLLAHIDTNLAALSVMEIQDTASDYSRIFNEALHIGSIVQREMQAIEFQNQNFIN